MEKRKLLIPLLALTIALTLIWGCQKKKETKPKAKAATTTTQSASSTPATSSSSNNSGQGITGTASDVINVPNYTYVQVTDKMGVKTWVAVPSCKIKKGQKVTFAPGVVMRDFHSNTLNRTFHSIVFSSGLASSSNQSTASSSQTCPAGAPAAKWPKSGKTSGTSNPMGMAGMMGGSVSETVGAGPVHPSKTNLKIKKASGKNAYTIAQLYKLASKLNNKEITVRGKVIKVLPNIMGRNWIHIQDGTGGVKTKDYDLVVTSQDLPSKGDIVTVKGILHANKDFGYGYKYPVIIEDAHITIK